MNILILAVGRNKGYLGEEIVETYSSRISRYASLEWKHIPTSDLKTENEKIIKAIPDNSYIVLLDEKGKSMTSMDFSEFMQKRRNESVKNLVIIIGGAYGFTEETRNRADFTWSLSPLTFPHELVRTVLAEQLYRAFTILKGEKYHHE